MCGIIGSIGKNIDSRFCEQGIEAILHRGPDSQGTWQSPDTRVFFGHTRLSIIDLSSAGSQPMMYKGKDGHEYQIVFNGEVYNYKEIRDELLLKGYTFQSDSDTEVILLAFVTWGKSCVSKFRGMFSFAIYDLWEKKLFLCRDRFGVKPLYYYHKDTTFLFSSELKALYTHSSFEKKINETAVSLYFQLGYIPAPHTIFQHTYKMRPGTWMEVDTNAQIQEETYWRAVDTQTDTYHQLSEEETLIQLEEKLLESFQYRMVADVDVGMFLSGGIDSSLVATLLQKDSIKKIHTFTIGFEEKEYDEAPYAKQIASVLGTDHHELYISSKDVLAELDTLTHIFDEPFGDSSSIPTYILSQFTKQHVKVALSGDGGDELFGGYSKYEALWKLSHMSGISKSVLRGVCKMLSPQQISQLYQLLPTKKYSNVREKISKLAYTLEGIDMRDQYMRAGTYWTPEDLRTVLGMKEIASMSSFFSPEKGDVREQLSIWDMEVYLPDDILVKADRTTMAVGLEGREPFLDHVLLSFVSGIEPEFRFRQLGTKSLLRQVLGKYIDIGLFDRPKTGFRPPIDTWLRSELSEKLDVYLGASYIKKQGLFDPVLVATFLNTYRLHHSINPDKVWLLLQFQMWWKTYMD